MGTTWEAKINVGGGPKATMPILDAGELSATTDTLELYIGDGTANHLIGPSADAGINWRGAWSSATSYAVNDAVSIGGSSYICTAANTNQQPPNATYWDVLAQEGASGSGVSGVTASAPLTSSGGNTPNISLTGTVPAANLPAMGASGGSHAAGIVPDPGSTAGTTRFLREDATWAAPSGGGGGSISNGSARLSSKTSLSPGTYIDTGLSVSLPAAGTYLLAGTIICEANMPSGMPSGTINVKLRNNTTGIDIPNTQRIAALFGDNAGGLAIDDAIATALTEIVTITGSASIALWGNADNSFTGSIREGSVLNWIRLV